MLPPRRTGGNRSYGRVLFEKGSLGRLSGTSWVARVCAALLLGFLAGVCIRGMSAGQLLRRSTDLIGNENGRAPRLDGVALPIAASERTGETRDEAARETASEKAKNNFKPTGVTLRVPILMYHEIGPGQEHLSELYVDEADFRKQVEYLKSQGYSAVSLKQVYLGWLGRAEVPAKPVVLTFDDGYASTYHRAFPILKSNGLSGTLFLELNMLSRDGGVTEDQVREWLKAGFELGSHTISHPDLTRLDEERLWREIKDSKLMLEERFGVCVDFFCYPAGRYNQTVVDATRKAGYLGAVTVEYGLADGKDLFRIKRIRVNRSDGLKGFIEKMNSFSTSG